MKAEHNIEKIQPNIAPFRNDGIPKMEASGMILLTYHIR